MIKIGPDAWIDPAWVVLMEFDRRHYANGPGDLVLILKLSDGTERRVIHNPRLYGGADVYAIQQAILAGKDRLAAAG